MSLAIIPKINSADELREPIARAALRVEECDSILIIMQKKEGGMLWFAPDSGHIETASFMATSFLHWLHSLKEDR